MLESWRLERSSSAAAPVLGCRVLYHSGEPFPRMSPSLLNTGLALSEGSISSSPHVSHLDHETGSDAWGRLCSWTTAWALFLIFHSCMKALRTPQLLPASHPVSVLNSHSMQDSTRAGQHLHPQLLPCSMGTSCFPAFSVCSFCHRHYQSGFQKTT